MSIEEIKMLAEQNKNDTEAIWSNETMLQVLAEIERLEEELRIAKLPDHYKRRKEGKKE